MRDSRYKPLTKILTALLPGLVGGLALCACGGPPAPTLPTIERAEELAQQGMLQDAESEAAAVLARGIPGEKDRAYTARGCIRVERGDARGAADDLQKVYRRDARGNLCLGKAYALQARYEEAYPLLAPALEREGFDAETARLAIQSAFALRLVPEGRKLARKAIAAFPADVALLTLWAQSQALTGDPDGALETLEHAGKIDRTSPDVPFVHANILWAFERYDEAAALYRTALKRNPRFVEAARNLGIALIQSGRYEEALEANREALRLAPHDIRVMNNLGVALVSTGHIQEAAALYEKALEALPGDERLLNNLVDVYIRLKRLDEAEKLLAELLQRNPQRENARTRQQDLETLRVLLGFICLEKHPAKATRNALRDRNWNDHDIAQSLERVLENPIFTSVLAEQEQACRK